jgi:glutathione S-transferase
MSDVILHHYAMSPFAEKIRAVVGYKRLSWRSVDIPIVMPKPDLTALTGGYRKTPVLQIGCDVYCDTTLIARVLDEIAPGRPVYRPERDALAVPAGRWLDRHLFFAVMPLMLQPAALAATQAMMGDELFAAFVRDRGPMMAAAPVKPPSLGDARVVFDQTLRALNAQLGAAGPFLSGDVIGWVDFCAYHPLWMLQSNGVLVRELDAYPHVTRWMARIAELGHGAPQPLSSSEALAIARESRPRASSGDSGQGLDGIALGATVDVAADDYAIESSRGRLVSVTLSELAIERTDERAGRVLVHFPRVGYRVKAGG